MPKKKRQKQDETTYKSNVFGSPVVRVLIIIAIAAFIFVLFAGDAFRILQGASATDTYIRVNGNELFVTNFSGKPQLSTEARQIINTLGRLNQQMSQAQYDPSQFQSMMDSFYRGSVEQLVTEEIYKQEAEKVGITIPLSKFTDFAQKDYKEIIERSESQEGGSQRELPPASLDAHEFELKREYRKNNVKRPIDEAVLLSDLDIIHRHKITDSTSIVNYAFYSFNDFLEESMEDIEIEDQTLIDFLTNNEKIGIVTIIETDVLTFDTEEEAEKATMEKNPFTMEENKDRIIKSVMVDRKHRYFDDIKDVAPAKWKVDVLSYRGSPAIYRVVEKISSKNFEEIDKAGAKNELIKEYIRNNATEYVDEFKTTAEEKMIEFKKQVEEGGEFFKIAGNMNLNIFGKTKEIAMNQESPQPNEKEPFSLNQGTISKHTNALRKAASDGDLILYAFSTTEGKVSDVLNTSENKELDIFTEDDYFYVIEPMEIKLEEELTNARKKTIRDNLKSELSNDFTELKMEMLRRSNNVEVDYTKIRSVLDQTGVMTMPEPVETTEPIPGSESTGGDGGLGIGGGDGGLGLGGGGGLGLGDGGGLGLGGDTGQGNGETSDSGSDGDTNNTNTENTSENNE
jgi:hypothetical protein